MIEEDSKYDHIQHENSQFMCKEETDSLFNNSKTPATPIEEKLIKIPEVSIIKTNGTNHSRDHWKTDWTFDLPAVKTYDDSDKD